MPIIDLHCESCGKTEEVFNRNINNEIDKTCDCGGHQSQVWMGAQLGLFMGAAPFCFWDKFAHTHHDGVKP